MYRYTRFLENYLKPSNALVRATNISLSAQWLPLGLFLGGIVFFGFAVLLNLFQ